MFSFIPNILEWEKNNTYLVLPVVFNPGHPAFLLRHYESVPTTQLEYSSSLIKPIIILAPSNVRSAKFLTSVTGHITVPALNGSKFMCYCVQLFSISVISPLSSLFSPLIPLHRHPWFFLFSLFTSWSIWNSSIFMERSVPSSLSFSGNRYVPYKHIAPLLVGHTYCVCVCVCVCVCLFVVHYFESFPLSESLWF